MAGEQGHTGAMFLHPGLTQAPQPWGTPIRQLHHLVPHKQSGIPAALAPALNFAH